MVYFAWLAEEFGFAVIDNEIGTMGYCGFTLRAGDCQLRMEVERGHLQFGEVSLAQTADQLERAVAGSRWYTIRDVLDYLRGYYRSWSEIEQDSLTDSEEETLTRLAKECRTAWPQVMELFQRVEFVRRQEDLEAFLRRKQQDLDAQFWQAANSRTTHGVQ